MRVAVLDDYLDVGCKLADWSAVENRAEVTVFTRNLKVPDEAAAALADYDALCMMRERMAVPRALIERLPKLKLMTVVGQQHRTLDLEAATERGILVCNSPSDPAIHLGTPELAWGLMLDSVRQITASHNGMQAGQWQTGYGFRLAGRKLGILGLGRIGRRMAEYGRAFGMEVIAWSQNLTAEAAAAGGARRVEKDELFAESDVLSLHVVLSRRTQGIVGAREIGLMKPSAHLINTARAGVVDQDAMVAALREGRLAGAAMDVFDEEPLPAGDKLLRVKNLILTPHLGYMVEESLRIFYQDMADAVAAFLDGAPIRVTNPRVVT